MEDVDLFELALTILGVFGFVFVIALIILIIVMIRYGGKK